MTLPTTKINLLQYGRELRLFPIANCLLDTGATNNFLNYELFINSTLQILPLENNLSLENAISTMSSTITHQCIADVEINKNLVIKNQIFLLIPDLKFQAILGLPALKNRNLHIKKDNTIVCNHLAIQAKLNTPFNCIFITSTKSNNEKASIITTEYNVVSPLEEKYIKICELKEGTPGSQIITIDELLQSGCLINPVYEKARKECKIKNHSNNVVIIEKGAVIGSKISNPAATDITKLLRNFIVPKKEEVSCNLLVHVSKIGREDLFAHNKELREWQQRRDKLVKEISLSQEIQRHVKKVPKQFQTQLHELLIKHNWSFSRNPNDSGMNQKWLISLELKPTDPGTPNFTRPYRISDPSLIKELDSKIANMEKFGILQRTTSPWNSPILTVKKKNGGLRVVNNYSANVNKRLICSHFPITPLRTILRKFSESIAHLRRNFPTEEILISAIDFRNGYYVLSVRESQRDVTSFICNNVQMRYARLSQGLSLAPSAFQRFLDICFGNLDGKFFFILSYLDDYLILSTASRHAEALDIFFTKCRQENIICALEKCELFSKSVEFLGYVISESGIGMKRNKLDALKKLPYPTTRKRAQAYLGCFNYFMRSVPKLSFYLKPICQAISGDKKFELTENMKKSIDILREKMDEILTLHHLDLSTEDNNIVFIVSDASLTHAGFAIGNASRVGDELSNFKVSAFGSKNFDQVTCDLPARSRELIALASALEYFSDLLPVTHPVTAIVDHKSLTNIQTQVTLGKGSYHTRIRNAYAIIFNFSNLSLVYSPGDSDILKIADGFSRVHPAPIKPIDKFSIRQEGVSLNNIIVTEKVIERKFIKEAQEHDEFCIQIMNNLRKHQNFSLTNGLLYKKQKGKLLCVIPDKLAVTIINYLHIQSMHRGLKALRRLIHRSNVFIKDMTKRSHLVVSRCLWCQFHTKRHKTSKDEQIMQKPSFAPFQLVALDLMEYTFSARTVYLLTFLDLFTLYLDSEVLYSKNAEIISSAILRLSMRYNCSFRSTYINDNGREFKNNLLADMLKKLGIIQTFTSPYNSRANRIERAHREVRHNLKVLNPNGQSFSHKVCLAISAWNSSPQKALGFKSPSELLYGFKPLNHLGFLQDEIVQSNPTDPQDSDLNNRLETLNDVHRQQALRNLVKFENANFKSTEIVKGDLVLLHDPKLKVGHDALEQDRGPFIVQSIILRTARLRHLISNHETSRNTRFLQKLKLSQEDREKILAQNQKMIIEHKILPLPDVSSGDIKLQIENEETQPRRSERLKLHKQPENKNLNQNKHDIQLQRQRASNNHPRVYKAVPTRQSARIKNLKYRNDKN